MLSSNVNLKKGVQKRGSKRGGLKITRLDGFRKYFGTPTSRTPKRIYSKQKRILGRIGASKKILIATPNGFFLRCGGFVWCWRWDVTNPIV